MSQSSSAFEKWIPAWNRLGFAVYCLSTVFMVLFSVLAVQGWPPPYNYLSIGLAALAPPAMLLVPLLYRREFSRQFLLTTAALFALAFLAFCNSQKSPAHTVTLKAMVLFLLTGPVIFWMGCFLFRSRTRQTLFLWLLSGILSLELYLGWALEHFKKLHIDFRADTYGPNAAGNMETGFGLDRLAVLHPFSNDIILTLSNPIPAGSVLLLLFAGPLLLIRGETSWPVKILQGVLLLAGVGLVFLIGKKGPALSLLVPVIIFALMRPRWILGMAAGILIALLLTWSVKPDLIAGYAKGFTDGASYNLRLEGWNFGLHVFLSEPFLGAGFNAPLSPWIKEYTPSGNSAAFLNHIQATKTLENMPLTMLAEMGLLFVLAYAYLLWPAFRDLPQVARKNPFALMLAACIGCFVFHSLTFDSLRYPPLNWLFHSLLALLAAQSGSFQTDSAGEDKST